MGSTMRECIHISAFFRQAQADGHCSAAIQLQGIDNEQCSPVWTRDDKQHQRVLQDNSPESLC